MMKFSNKGYYPIHIAALNNCYFIIEYLYKNCDRPKELIEVVFFLLKNNLYIGEVK